MRNDEIVFINYWRKIGKVRKSIFELEKKISLQNELERLIRFMHNEIVSTDILGAEYSFYSYMNSAVGDWEYRGTAFSIEEYLQSLDIEMENITFISDKESLAILELFANLIPVTIKYIDRNTSASIYRAKTIAQKVKENIIIILEQINMQLSNVGDREIITKRDVDVDSVLELIPDLSEVLLGYMDFRNRDDLKYKRQTLKALADELEPKRKSFLGTPYSSLYDSTAYAYNNFSIRHNNNRQIEFKTKEEQIRVYDAVFIMSLQLLRAEKVSDCKEVIDGYK